MHSLSHRLLVVSDRHHTVHRMLHGLLPDSREELWHLRRVSARLLTVCACRGRKHAHVLPVPGRLHSGRQRVCSQRSVLDGMCHMFECLHLHRMQEWLHASIRGLRGVPAELRVVHGHISGSGNVHHVPRHLHPVHVLGRHNQVPVM